MSAAAPDLLEAVIAFRGWRVADGALLSPLAEERWTGVVRARCRPELRSPGAPDHPPDQAPHPDCRCGLHAYHAPGPPCRRRTSAAWSGSSPVWGRLEVHPEGVRAEVAQVRALGLSPRWSSWQRAAVREVARELDVPLVEEAALAATASEFGAPLPVGLR